MKSPFFFLIEPYGDEYQNTVEIAGQKIIVNSSLEDHKHVNRFAKVLQVPIHYQGAVEPPTRSAVVSDLLVDARVEVEVVAYRPSGDIS